MKLSSPEDEDEGADVRISADSPITNNTQFVMWFIFNLQRKNTALQ